MTPAQIAAAIEADMKAAVIQANSEGISTSAGASTIKSRVLTAYNNAIISVYTPWLGTGVPANRISFTASLDHASVTNYQARLRAVGSSTVVATQNLGVPTPDVYGVIVVDLTTLFSGVSAGNYTVSIATTTAAGTTDSGVSNAFALPLS